MDETNGSVVLSGFAHSKFTRRTSSGFMQMVRQVVAESLRGAGLEPSDIDYVVLSHFNRGLLPQGFTAGLSSEIDDGFRFTPSVRVENACASGSAAVHMARALVLSSQARRVLVIGAEHMSTQSSTQIGEILQSAALQGEFGDEVRGFAGIFDQIAAAYDQSYGSPREAMSLIASKNRTNGSRNPWAQLQTAPEPATLNEASPENPAVGRYLLKSDCSPISDGAAALLVSRAEDLPDSSSQVRLKATSQVNDFMSMRRRDMSQLGGPSLMWNRLLNQAKASHDDLDFAEVHDCFSIAELMLYEAMGLAAPGKGLSILKEGHVHLGGRLPINPSGGLLAKGHPIGATGVSMHVMACMQLTGQWSSGVRVSKGRAGIINMGGTAVANYGSILELPT